MEEIQRLVKLIEKKGKLGGSQLINFIDEDNLETKLYFFLKNNEFYEDDLAIKHLYGSVDKKDAFKMLKSRFKKKVYNQLHFINLNSYQDLFSAEIKLNTILGEANLLCRSVEYELAEKRVLTAIDLAKKYSLTNEIVRGLEIYQRILIDGYYNKQKYNKCEKDLQESYQLLAYEREATSLYNEVFINISAGIESRFEVLSQITDILDKMESLWNKTGSPKIFKQFHKVKMGYYELTGKFLEQIDYINEINARYKRGLINPFYYSLALNKYVISYSCLRAKEYEKGIEAAADAKSLVESNTHNWFSIMENYLLLHIHSKRFEQVRYIIDEVCSNAFLINLDQNIKERWLLHTEFYSLLTGNRCDSQFEKITFVVNKDKKGYNTWLIILDFLTLLKQGKYDLLHREAERIRKYINKHLDTNSDPRYKLFMKVLLIVVKEDFDPVRFKQKSKYLYSKLKDTPPAGDAYAEVEIVPFEHLWEFILNTLTEQRAKTI